MLIEGDDAIQQTFNVKASIRRRYVPTDFDREAEMSYPNFMHAADNKAQVQNDVQVLLPESLEFIPNINGDHPMTEQIW